MTKPVSIRCRGNKIIAHPVANRMSLMVSHIGDVNLFLSNCEPIAIQYKNKSNSSIMTFKKFGEDSIKDKIELRLNQKYVTVMQNEFNYVLLGLFKTV